LGGPTTGTLEGAQILIALEPLVYRSLSGPDMELGKAIKLIRVASGLKQKDIATKLDVTPNYISLIESGNREPSVSLLKSLANIFGVPVGLFFLWEETGLHRGKVDKARGLLTQLEALYVIAQREKAQDKE
jgi:transcriptional regulator with XRE-family HTH domain